MLRKELQLMSKDRNLELKEGLPISKLKHHVAKFHIGDQVQIPAELLQNDNIVPNSPYMDAVIHSICTHHIVYHLKNGAYVSLDNFDNLQVRIQKPAAFSSYSEEQELQDVLNSMMQKDCHK